MKIRFRIMGRYTGQVYVGSVEVLDACKKRSTAERLLQEYRMAFGLGWRIWIDEV